MKQIRLWEVQTPDPSKPTLVQLDSVSQTETEQLLEEILVRWPDLLLQDLKLVGRQTDTPGGPLDLLGIDSDGRLVVFELKRGTLTREAVAQVIDYASYLSELEPEELANHISERSGRLGIERIDDFLAWYQQEFAEPLPYPQSPRMVLVGLGADERTRRMVSFLADSDLEISLITFHGFDKDGTTLLARQVEVEAKPPVATLSVTKTGNLEILRQRIAQLGLDQYYYKMARFFQDQLPAAYQWPNQGGYSYYLSESTESGSMSNRVYASLYVHEPQPGHTQVYLHRRAVEAASDSFLAFQDALEGNVEVLRNGAAAVWIHSPQEWDDLAPTFGDLCQAIVKGWKAKREQEVQPETQPGSGDGTSLD